MISFLNIDNIDTAKYGHLIIVIIRVEYSWTLWLIWNLNEYGKSMVFTLIWSITLEIIEGSFLFQLQSYRMIGGVNKTSELDGVKVRSWNTKGKVRVG